MHSRLKQLHDRLPEAMSIDRRRLHRELQRIRQTLASGGEGQRTELDGRLRRQEIRLRRSIARKAQRRSNRPRPADASELPIAARKDAIVDAIRRHAVVIVSGATGSGKTTQLPKYCLEAGRGIDGLIGHTQPRRIAATSVAQRIAHELGESVGQSVGYKIRFADRTGPNGYIKVMTDGILLAEAQQDPFLAAYDTFIVDEAHERSLNIDFVLGLLNRLLKQRRELKLIITSATIDTQKFSRAFQNAPVVEVSGRMYPVEVHYLDDASDPSADPVNGESRHIEMTLQAVDRLERRYPPGDILIFMPTEQDIRETCELLAGHDSEGAVILPLFARLAAEEQARIFAPARRRKIIVATNVAETSLTIPGIRYVVDTGLARLSLYSPRTRTTSLPVTRISRSSADQRMGRCGRMTKGVCIRLYSEEDYVSRPVFTPPEIRRANLAEVILRMLALRLGDIAAFPFIDPPTTRSIADGLEVLRELGAIAPSSKRGRAGRGGGRLTARGRLMAAIPLDPRLARMLVEADREKCLPEVAVIVSALSIQDPRERPAEKTAEADQAQAEFDDPASDFVRLLTLWRRYRESSRKAPSRSRQRKRAARFCRDHYLSCRRMREWQDVRTEIVTIVKESGLRYPRREPRIPPTAAAGLSSRYGAIHRAVLSGLLSNIATRKEGNRYRAANGREVMLFPGSGLFNRSGAWIVAAEIVETSRVFARTAAKINPAWLEDLAGELCRSSYHDPHWDAARGRVIAYQQVTLFGLVIVERRPVAYGPVAPAQAKQIFIREALVQGRVGKAFAFVQHNRKLVADIRDMENRLRRRDLFAGDAAQSAFYDRRLPTVYDLQSLARHIEKSGDDRHLRMQPDDLLTGRPDPAELALFPDRVRLGGRSLRCQYRFEPGEPADGVTVRIPASVAPRISPASVEWLVPGLLKAKITSLIKGLPKHLRKRLVPVAPIIDTILAEMPGAEEPLAASLSAFIHHRFGVDVPAAAWSVESLPDYLKMRLSIIDAHGAELAAGRDPSLLRSAVTEPVDRAQWQALRRRWERSGLTVWDFGDLPAKIPLQPESSEAPFAYPGLQASDTGQSGVDLRLFRSVAAARKAHRRGVGRLLALHLRRELKFLKRRLTLSESQAAAFGGPAHLAREFCDRIIEQLFAHDVRRQEAFFELAESLAPQIQPSGEKLLEAVVPVIDARLAMQAEIRRHAAGRRANPALTALGEQLRQDLDRLVPGHFMHLYSLERMQHLPRYIIAMTVRLQRAAVDFEKDRAKAAAWRPMADRLQTLLAGLAPDTSDAKRLAVEDFYWLLEEYKVSVFAQELKTAVPVSRQRLETRYREILRML